MTLNRIESSGGLGRTGIETRVIGWGLRGLELALRRGGDRMGERKRVRNRSNV